MGQSSRGCDVFQSVMVSRPVSPSENSVRWLQPQPGFELMTVTHCASEAPLNTTAALNAPQAVHPSICIYTSLILLFMYLYFVHIFTDVFILILMKLHLHLYRGNEPPQLHIMTSCNLLLMTSCNLLLSRHVSYSSVIHPKLWQHEWETISVHISGSVMKDKCGTAPLTSLHSQLRLKSAHTHYTGFCWHAHTRTHAHTQ